MQRVVLQVLRRLRNTVENLSARLLPCDLRLRRLQSTTERQISSSCHPHRQCRRGGVRVGWQNSSDSVDPFEVQSSYGGTVAGRHNLDVQDMRRVLDPALWLGARDCLPQIGGLAPQLGYMSRFEWNGTAYEGRSTSSPVPVSWISRRQLAAGFREDWLRAHEGEKMEDPLAAAKQISSASSESSSEDEDLDFDKAIRCGVSEAFADGINSGFYVNSCSLMMLIVFKACSAAHYHTSCLCVCSGSGYQTKPNPDWEA